MAIDKNKILATEGQVAEICNVTINNLNGAANSVLKNNLSPDKILVSDVSGKISTANMSFSELNELIAANSMALTAGTLTWNGTFDNLYRVPIGSEDGIDFGFVRVTEEVPDDFSIMASLEMEVPTFFGVASALTEPIYQGIEIMPEVDPEMEGIYLYFSEIDSSMPLAAIACEGNTAGMPVGVYFLYTSMMDKTIMSVASMRLPSYAFKSNNYFVTEQDVIEIPNQSAYYWDGDYNSGIKQGTVYFGDTPLTFYTKYVGECDLTFEELANKSVIGIYKDGTECVINTLVNDNYIELAPMGFFVFSGVFITKEANVQVNEYITLAEPGVHFFCVDYPALPILTFVDIKDSNHTLYFNNKTSVIQKSHLPEYLQLGDINETYTVQKLRQTTNSLGETLYWDSDNTIVTGDNMEECRIADFIEIPSGTVITGVHNKTGETINLTIVDDKIWAPEDVPGPNTIAYGGWYGVIRKNGIYLCNFGGKDGYIDTWLSSITFSGMNFTKTIYNIESEEIETTKFKTLDEKYLPEISYEDLVNKPSLCSMTFVENKDSNTYQLEFNNAGHIESISLNLLSEDFISCENFYNKKLYRFTLADMNSEVATQKLESMFLTYQNADHTKTQFININGFTTFQGVGNSCSYIFDYNDSANGLYLDMGMINIHILTNNVELLEGDGQEFYTTAPSTLSFRSTAPLNELQDIQINGAIIDSSNYELEEGSTIVKLKYDYLNTLNIGNHEITVVSNNKIAKGEFNVVAPTLNEYGFYYNMPYYAFIEETPATFAAPDSGAPDSGSPNEFSVSGEFCFVITNDGYAWSVGRDGFLSESYIVENGDTYTIGDTSARFTGTFTNNGTKFISTSVSGDSGYLSLITEFNINPEIFATDEEYYYILNPDNNSWSATPVIRGKETYLPLKTYICDKPVTAIAISAFLSNQKINSFIIPDTITILKANSFRFCTKLTNITFQGTMEQWNAITKEAYWNTNVPATHVHCIDGDVAI